MTAAQSSVWPSLNVSRICSPAKAAASHLSRRVNHAAGVPDAAERVGLPDRRLLAHDEIHLAVAAEHHHGGVERGVAAADDGDRAAFVVADVGNLVVHVLRGELVQHAEPPRIVQQAAGDDDLAAQVAALAGDHPLQPILGLHIVGLVDGDEFLVEPELHQGLHGLPVRALRQLLAGNAVGKARDVDDPLVGVEKVRLAARRALGLDDERGERAMRGGEARGQTGGSGADDHDIPVRKMVEIEVRLERLDAEIGHSLSLVVRPIRMD